MNLRTQIAFQFHLNKELSPTRSSLWVKAEAARQPFPPSPSPHAKGGVFQIEPCSGHVRSVVAPTASLMIGPAAFNAAVGQYPGQRLALRKGAMLIREHPRSESSQ